ncbi:TetR/AcrR family transcriptional regulator [Streptomyces camelliae]|uniref:Helix-turn-helix domain containing protein n=1 Tax=Streptomyces camelliae TaxID=3004093 RepID=A0ABY7NWQ5_9ACTN|nr:TetR/AcrR family transcriptional regulator [Streptomyces sp. HUAS 2-6]WBO61528.1 helix-turn-helix domain containing protein [Streptomyces sp. HUAS 2-6]
MPRWEPNAQQRLMRAALDLFTEKGYDATTVNEIADRAGLTKTTFFRHFSDKREVLFAGQDIHRRLLAQAINAAPEAATPLDAVREAIGALAAVFTDDRREFAARLRPIVADHLELRERAALKRTGLVETLAKALEERGVPDLTADLAADLGMRAFDNAFDQWVVPANERSLTDLARRAFDELRAAMAFLHG